MSFNGLWMKLTQGMHWHVQGLENLSRDQWYFVIGNHQSAADIFIAQYLLNKRTPMLKFFLKQELIYDQNTFRHPVYDLAALQAQQSIAAQNGANHTWFCGAWMKNGFHEDGLSSGLDVATAIDAQTALRVAAE